MYRTYRDALRTFPRGLVFRAPRQLCYRICQLEFID